MLASNNNYLGYKMMQVFKITTGEIVINELT